MEWLKAIRHDRGMLQSQVARSVFISQPAYANIENGKRIPSVPTAKKIAEALNFDWQRFYEDRDQPA